MTTFEEDIVEIYYNLKGFFTIKNISYPAKGKKISNNRREAGEIDLLGINPIKKEAVHVEVSTSVTVRFPHDRKGISRLEKKFLKAKNLYVTYIGNGYKIKPIFVVGGIDEKKAKNKFDIKFKKDKDETSFTNKKIGKIRIITFNQILDGLVGRFIENDILLRNFQDSRMRGSQYFVIKYLSNVIKMPEKESAKSNIQYDKLIERLQSILTRDLGVKKFNERSRRELKYIAKLILKDKKW